MTESLISKYIFRAEGLDTVAAQAAALGGKLQAQGMSYGSTMGKGLKSGFTKIFSPENVGMAITAAVAAGVYKSISMYADWEAQSSAAVAKMGINTSEALKVSDPSQYAANVEKYNQAIQNVQDISKELGTSTVFSAAQVGGAFEELAAVGVDVGAMSKDQMKPFLDIAAATKYSIPEATKITMATMKQFGLGMDESARATDVLAYAAGATSADLGDFGAAFQYVAPLAASMGYDIETTTSYVGVLRDKGIEASRAGTGLANMFSRLSGSSDRVGKYLGEVGLTLDDVNPRAHKMTDVLRTVADATGVPREGFAGISEELDKMTDAGMTNEQMYEQLVAQGGAVGQFMKIFGQETGPTALALLTSADAADKLNQELYESGGAAGSMAAQQLDNLKGSFEMFSGALEGIGLAFGDLLAPALRGTADLLSTYVLPAVEKGIVGLKSVFGTLWDFVGPTVQVVASIGGGILKGLVGVGKGIYSSISPALDLISKLGSSTSAWGAKITGVINKIPFESIGKKLGSALPVFAMIGKGAESFQTASRYVSAFVAELTAIPQVSSAISSLKKLGADVISWIKDAPQKVKSFISDLKSDMGMVKEAILGPFEEAGEGISDVFSGLADPIREMISKIVDSVRTALEPIYKLMKPFSDSFGESWDAIDEFFNRVETRADDSGKTLVTTGANTGQGFTESEVSAIEQGQPEIIGAIESQFEGAEGVGAEAGSETGEEFTEAMIDAMMKAAISRGLAGVSFAEAIEMEKQIAETGVYIRETSEGHYKTARSFEYLGNQFEMLIEDIGKYTRYTLLLNGALLSTKDYTSTLAPSIAEVFAELSNLPAPAVGTEAYGYLTGNPIEAMLAKSFENIDTSVIIDSGRHVTEAFKEIGGQINTAFSGTVLDSKTVRELISRVKDLKIVDPETFREQGGEVGLAWLEGLEAQITHLAEVERILAQYEMTPEIEPDTLQLQAEAATLKRSIQSEIEGDIPAVFTVQPELNLGLFGGLKAEDFWPTDETGKKVTVADIIADPEKWQNTIDNFNQWRTGQFQPALNDFMSDVGSAWKSGYVSQEELDKNYFDALYRHATDYQHWYKVWQWNLIQNMKEGIISLEQFFEIWENGGKLVEDAGDKVSDNLADLTAEGSGFCDECMSEFGKAQEAMEGMFFPSYIGPAGDAYDDFYARKIAKIREVQLEMDRIGGVHVGKDYTGPEYAWADAYISKMGDVYAAEAQTVLGHQQLIDLLSQTPPIDTVQWLTPGGEAPTVTPKVEIDQTSLTNAAVMVEEMDLTSTSQAQIDPLSLTTLKTEVEAVNPIVPVGIDPSAFWLGYSSIVSEIQSSVIYIPVDVDVVANIPAIVSAVKAQIEAELYS